MVLLQLVEQPGKGLGTVEIRGRLSSVEIGRALRHHAADTAVNRRSVQHDATGKADPPDADTLGIDIETVLQIADAVTVVFHFV